VIDPSLLFTDILASATSVPKGFVVSKFQATLLRKHYGWHADPPWLIVAPDLPES
jgi:hypothetical protein